MNVPKKAWFLSSALQVITWAVLQSKSNDPGTPELEHRSKILALLQSSHALTMLRWEFFASLMNKWDKCSFQPLLRLTLVI